jgi:hypothetical protein
MATHYAEKPPVWFWAAGVLGLLWNLIGAAFYLGQRGILSGPFAPPPGAPEMPIWATIAFAIGVWGGVLALVLLLMRNRLARPLLWISFLALVVDWGWVFFASGAGIQPLGIAVLVIALGLALLGDIAVKRGWLR